MTIQEKINQKSFWLFYLITAFIVTFSYVYSYFYIDYPRIKEANPVVHYLALNFSQIFHTSYENYYLYSLPFILLAILLAAKFAKWLVKIVDKKAKISGDKHVVVFIALLNLPNWLHQLIVVLFGIYLIDNPITEFKLTTILGFMLALFFLIYTETRK